MAFKLSAITWSHHYSFELGKINDFGLIDLYAKEGLGGIEFIMEHIKSHDERHLLKLKQHANLNGLEISCVSPGNNFGNLKKKDNDANLKYVKRGVDTAHILGAANVRVFAGWPPQGMANKLWKNAVKYMKEAGKYAATKGITLAVEPHNGGGFLPSSALSIKFIRDVNLPNVRLNLDTGNYLGHDRDIYAGIRNSVKYSSYCHLKIHSISRSGKTADFDMDRTFKALAGGGYRGWIAVEYEGQEFVKGDKKAKAANESACFGFAVKKAKDMIKLRF